MVTNTSESAPEKTEPETEPEKAPKNREEELEAKLKDLETRFQEEKNKYLYLYAEFENFRRRNEQERINFRKFGHEYFLKDLLQVLDNFERAAAHAKSMNPEKGSPLAGVVQGVDMIHYQLLEAVKAQGVSEIVTAGAKFDPNFHEAVAEEESDKEAGTILKEHVKGYMLYDRLLRAAKVTVAKKKA